MPRSLRLYIIGVVVVGAIALLVATLVFPAKLIFDQNCRSGTEFSTEVRVALGHGLLDLPDAHRARRSRFGCPAGTLKLSRSRQSWGRSILVVPQSPFGSRQSVQQKFANCAGGFLGMGRLQIMRASLCPAAIAGVIRVALPRLECHSCELDFVGAMAVPRSSIVLNVVLVRRWSDSHRAEHPSRVPRRRAWICG